MIMESKTRTVLQLLDSKGRVVGRMSDFTPRVIVEELDEDGNVIGAFGDFMPEIRRGLRRRKSAS